MKRWRVRIYVSEIEVEADSQDEAEDKAMDVMYGDTRTHLDYGFSVEGFETEEIENEE